MNPFLLHPFEDGRMKLDGRFGMALEKRRHGSGGDFAGVGVQVVEDAVAFAAGGFEVGRFEGESMAFFGFSGGGAEGEVAPPGSVVVPEVVVGVVFAAAGGEVVFRGHGLSVS